MKGITEELAEVQLKLKGTSWTNNEEFDQNGAILLRNVVNGSLLVRPKPESDDVVRYKKRLKQTADNSNAQVAGSIETYNYPDYIHYHRGVVKQVIEKAIGRPLYPTYFYDRFYLQHHALPPHTDRDACEISASMLISTTLTDPWPLYVVKPFDDLSDINAEMYDATDKDLIVYKGTECIHWRDNMPRGEHTHHQIFFHYVLQDGNRAFCAFDNGRVD